MAIKRIPVQHEPFVWQSSVPYHLADCVVCTREMAGLAPHVHLVDMVVL